MIDLRSTLERHFGHGSFRPGQETLVQAVLDGRDVLAVMPTGSGKSLCYQLPGVARGGTTLVVSPLIALMEDQVAKLIHTSNYYHVPLQEQLAARLTALSGLTNWFCCAPANPAAGATTARRSRWTRRRIGATSAASPPPTTLPSSGESSA